jgi:hypothetical protein
MKREKKLTKRERKATFGTGSPGGQAHGHQHIHCVACGRHLDPHEFDDPATATFVRCQHGSTFPSCVTCTARSQALLDEHDRTGQPVRAAAAWH